MTRTPFVLVGDLFGQPTGLSRILTDIAIRLAAETHLPFHAELTRNVKSLDLEVGVVGWANWEGLPPHGAPVEDHVLTSNGETHGIRCWAFNSTLNWGRAALETAYRSWFGDREGVVLTIWDAHRCWAITQAQLPVKWWGYVPVDGVNVNGCVGGGPVREGLERFDRVLAYTEFGGNAIRKTLGSRVTPIPYLPHGLNLDVWSPTKVDPAAMTKVRGYFARTIAAEALLVGTVATNQPRKDWGLVAATLAELRGAGEVHGWWHTDSPVSDAWSLPQLAEDFDLEASLTITTKLTDYELAAAYTCCAATIAPGRGEGFGYPISESLAMGTPVVHCDYAGGAEFTPAPWRLPVAAYHLEGAYGIQRPVVSATAVAEVLGTILTAAKQLGSDRVTLPRFVAPLDWTTLWGKWRDWIAEGL